MNSAKDKFKVLTDAEHILIRPSMYIGSVDVSTKERYINGKVENISFVPGLLKITNEIIDNSVAEFANSEKLFSTQIKINIDEKCFKCEDNGRGIPVELYKKQYIPLLAWTQTKAGTSFEENRKGASANGLGSVLANIFSKKFLGNTQDGTNSFDVICSDNMSIITHKIKSSKKRGTSVYIEPDFEKFSLKGYDENHITLLKERIYAISSINPEITFTFNNEKIRTRKPKEFLEKFGTDYVSYITDKYFLGLFYTQNEKYSSYGVIDGLELYNGGTHEEYISRMIANELRVLIKKKYKIDMTPNEIKSGLLLVIIGKEFENMKFDSQTKEKLTNSEAEVKEYFGKIDFEKIAKDLMKVESIIDPIIKTKLAIQSAKDARAVTLAQKQMKKVKVDKHISANSKIIRETTLFLCEGDSAAGMGRTVRNVNKHGFFPLRGIPMNCYESSHKEIIDNKELCNIMTITGLKFNVSNQEILASLKYGNVAILCDSDVDGTGAVLPLLLNFLYRWPILFEKQKIKFVRTPLYIATKGKDVKYFFTKDEFEKANTSGYEVRYIKGLGTLRKHEYAYCINNEQNWVTINIDDADCFRKMYHSKAVEERKKIMLG